MRFAPDIDLPESEVRDSGERRLLRAMLVDCLRTIFGSRGSDRAKWYDKDLAWVTSEERTDVFAFENVCEALGIDARYLRGRVLAAILQRRDPAARRCGA
jgi:hypothetical protein